MYYQYFGLKEAPFSIAVNPRYLFMSARHRDALAHLLYGVGQGGGFILLTGPVGTGKTTINRSVLEQLPDDTDIALVLNPTLNALELLATVCDELGINYVGDEELTLKNLTDHLHRFLLNNFAKGRNTVLLIDEAQHLKFEVLEQIRLLTNLETHTKKLLQIILVGQPELTELLAKPELSQLAQRITARYQLKPLNLAETDAYIRHRLRVAGLPANQELFKAKIVKHIFNTSGGVPRLINVLCDRMLLGTYGKNQTAVDMATARQASAEVLGEETDSPTQHPLRWPVFAAAATLLLVAGIALWRFVPTIVGQANSQPHTEPAPAQTSINENKLKPAPWYLDQQAALTELLTYINAKSSCQDTALVNQDRYLSCEDLSADSWQSLQSYDRPVLLHLISPGKMRNYAILVGIDQQNAELLINGQRQTMALEALGQRWTGSFTLVWHKPSRFETAIAEGSSGPLVTWLAQQFSQLDQQAQALAEDLFNARLSQRVMIFQRNHALKDDGVVGLKTLLKLNEAMGIETTTLSDATTQTTAANQPRVEGGVL